MSEISCNVIQDLMPQVIDGAASPDSKALVKRHMDTCSACREAYVDMTTQIRQRPPQDSEITARQAMRRIARGFTVRRIIALLAILALLVVGIPPAWEYLAVDSNRPMPLDWIEASLSVSKEGAVHLSGEMTVSHQKWDALSIDFLENGTIMLITPRCPILSWSRDSETGPVGWWLDLRIKNGKMQYVDVYNDGTAYDPELMMWTDKWSTVEFPVDQVWFGTEKEHVTLYTSGDELPYCGDEIQAELSDAGQDELPDEVQGELPEE